MKVVIFTTAYFPMIGGAEVAIKEVTDRMPEVEFHLFCAKLRRDTKRKERVGNILVHRVGFGTRFDKYLLAIFSPIRALFSMRSSQAIIWSVMASYGGFAGLFFSWMRPKFRFVLTLQEGDPVERYRKHAGMFEFLRKRIFRRADRVHVISRFLANWAKAMGVKTEPVVIPNGVDIPLFTKTINMSERLEARKVLGYFEDDVVLVTASRLSHKNAVDDVIRSLSYLPAQYKFLILGSGEDGEKLRALVDELQLSERVRFQGDVSHEKLPTYLQLSEIFVRPSRSEGLGNAFLEAMASSVPVIGTLVGGIPDFLLDGETGLRCEVDSPTSLAQAVKKLIEYPELRERIVEQGRELVKQKYDWDRIAKRMREEILL